MLNTVRYYAIEFFGSVLKTLKNTIKGKSINQSRNSNIATCRVGQLPSVRLYGEEEICNKSQREAFLTITAPTALTLASHSSKQLIFLKDG